MSQISKKKSLILLVLAVIVLVGICFATLTVYAKKELHKPKFEIPADKPIASASELPQDKQALCDYVNTLYDKALKADNAEGSWHTDVNLEGDIVTPFEKADESIFAYIKDNAVGEIAGLYPNEADVKMSESENPPVIKVNPEDIAEFTAEQGHTDEAGNVSDDDYYFISFEIKPESADTAGLTKSKVFEEVKKKLGNVADIREAEIECEGSSLAFKINRISDEIVSADVYNNYKVIAHTQLKPELTGLLPAEQDSLTANIEIPYKTAQHISFKWYGCRFTQRSMAVKPDDMKSLPADVRVNSEASKEDYKLTFTSSDNQAVSIDADGVMSVNKKALSLLAAPDEIVTVKIKLEYEGKTYTDELKVYITDLEVAADV